ncbi:prepilin-type N-terminal cleavage/methylation domain-containing protein [Chitiniphilus purpureus]|uniref:Prepilin-type N-terminal cleavage/methylation domain-containing protein n=1 Tax=Chitiniphilus purpureus TaxID=2981137 RepID=A0ABY6DUR9_9NEIS|nr:prepilin-type N-terminal cleavage/methylation domain-containing protein [Chitiniphilus sp. CD1]UXY16806.1 prepilin-type N-terminal cleavage/methylation domain-containing protein [Chitiniphilus sp. CD1]
MNVVAPRRGFTLIELLVVLAIMASLLTLVVPRYFQQTDKASETVLKHNLVAMRDALDKFYADTGRYPATLEEMVERKYLREIPVDPISGKRDAWQIINPENGTGVYDIKSGAPGNDSDGKAFSEY